MTKLGEICNIVFVFIPKSNVSEYYNGTINWIIPAEINDDTYIITVEEKFYLFVSLLEKSLLQEKIS